MTIFLILFACLCVNTIGSAEDTECVAGPAVVSAYRPIKYGDATYVLGPQGMMKPKKIWMRKGIAHFYVKWRKTAEANGVAFWCDMCGKAFNAKYDFEFHMRYRHGLLFVYDAKKIPENKIVKHRPKKYPENWRCDICGKKFGTSYAYYNHVIKTHHERPYIYEGPGELEPSGHPPEEQPDTPVNPDFYNKPTPAEGIEPTAN